jgi:hypothetical protein
VFTARSGGLSMAPTPTSGERMPSTRTAASTPPRWRAPRRSPPWRRAAAPRPAWRGRVEAAEGRADDGEELARRAAQLGVAHRGPVGGVEGEARRERLGEGVALQRPGDLVHQRGALGVAGALVVPASAS